MKNPARFPRITLLHKYLKDCTIFPKTRAIITNVHSNRYNICTSIYCIVVIFLDIQTYKALKAKVNLLKSRGYILLDFS